MLVPVRLRIVMALMAAIGLAVIASHVSTVMGDADPAESECAARVEIEELLTLSRHHWDRQDHVDAYALALRARRIDRSAERSSGAGRVIAEYQADLLAHQPSAYMALIRSERLRPSDRHELVGLLNVFTGLSGEWLKELDDDAEARIAQFVAQRHELSRALEQTRDRQTEESLLLLYAAEAEVYQAHGRPDLALNSLVEGHQREVAFGTSGSETSVLDFTIGRFFQDLWMAGEEVMLVLSSRDVPAATKRRIVSDLHEAVDRHDFRD